MRGGVSRSAMPKRVRWERRKGKGDSSRFLSHSAHTFLTLPLTLPITPLLTLFCCKTQQKVSEKCERKCERECEGERERRCEQKCDAEKSQRGGRGGEGGFVSVPLTLRAHFSHTPAHTSAQTVLL